MGVGGATYVQKSQDKTWIFQGLFPLFTKEQLLMQQKGNNLGSLVSKTYQSKKM